MQPSANQVVTRDLPPFAFRAAFEPASLNTTDRTVDVVWTTGARALRRYNAALNLWTPYYEELSLDPKHVRLDRLNDGAPFQDGHPVKGGDFRASISRGVIVNGSAKVDGKRGICRVRFAKAEDDPEADLLFRKVADGIVQKVSFGYIVSKYRQLEVQVNGMAVYQAIDWEPFEVSSVSVPEDAGAGFRSADTAQLSPCQFIERALSAADADRDRRLRLAHAHSL